jgi:hypothetical protein
LFGDEDESIQVQMSPGSEQRVVRHGSDGGGDGGDGGDGDGGDGGDGVGGEVKYKREDSK